MGQEILMTIFKWGIPIVLTGITTMIVKIYKDILNDGEYNIHKCQFDFDEEYNGVTNVTTTYEDGNEQMYLNIKALKNVWEVTK